MLIDQPALSTASYFDHEFDTQAVKIVAGEYFATANGTAITTLLGSCVSVCLYDRQRGVGGMNHFMLPKVLLEAGKTRCSPPHTSGCGNSCSTRYGECALKHLLERLENLGARRGCLEAKLFGAGRVMPGVTDIGEKNGTFAIEYLKERNIPVVASDLGDCYPRKLIFFPASGRAFVKQLAMEQRGTLS